MSTDADVPSPSLVHDYGDRPVQLRALLALWDTSTAMMWERLDGIGDHEWTWEAGPWPALRPLAWSAHHLGALGQLRSDWTTGEHRLGLDDLPTPTSTSAEGLQFLREGLEAWRDTLDRVDDQDLDTVGRSAFPDGLDPHLPLIDIAWWNTRELIHHVADMSTVRDLYAVRPLEGETP